MTKNLPANNNDNAEFWINLNYSDLIKQLQHKIDQQHQLDNLNKLQKVTNQKLKEAGHTILLAQNELNQNPQAEQKAVEDYQAQCRKQAIDKLTEDLLKIDPEFQNLDSEVKKKKDQLLKQKKTKLKSNCLIISRLMAQYAFFVTTPIKNTKFSIIGLNG